MRVQLLLLGALSALSLQAATFTLDPARSQITLSGTIGGSTLREQADNSLTTTVGGTIDITVASGQIQINSAALDPNTNGNWAPGANGQASSPADFGGQARTFGIDVFGALRDLLVSAASPSRPVAANGEFDASAIVFSFPTNSSSVLDYDLGFFGKGSRKLEAVGTNQTATVGTLIDNAGAQTLTIALDATFFFSLVANNDTSLQLKGQLVATSGGTPSGPNISGIEFLNGQVKISVSGSSAATRLQSSTDLVSWAPIDALPTTEGTALVFTVPAAGKLQFFRTAE